MNRTTSAPDVLVRLDRASAVPLRLQLERELRRAIHAGRLSTGSLVPSTRTLSADLAVSRGVVVEAYEQLLAEGYLTAARGSATRVADRRPASAGPALSIQPAKTYRYDFRPGLPDFSLFPRRTWVSAVRRALAAAPLRDFDYPPPIGVESARVALATYLNRARATVARPDQIVLCNGSTQAIALVCKALQSRGARRLAVEDPGHTDQCTDIQSCGLATPRIPVDDQGIRVDRLDRANADAVLVTPAHQYPTGAVLAPDRRAALLQWAERRGAFVIEDDYDAEYRYDREPVGALHGLAPDRVIYVGSASKVLSPALRLGWVVVPPQLIDQVSAAKMFTDRGSAALEQLAFAAFLERGAFDRHLRRTRLIYRRRRDVLLDAMRSRLPRLRIHGVAAGLHLLIELPNGFDESALIAAGERRLIRLYGAAAYRAHPKSGPPAVVLGYGGLPEPLIGRAVDQLALAIDECQTRSRTRPRLDGPIRSAGPEADPHAKRVGPGSPRRVRPRQS